LSVGTGPSLSVFIYVFAAATGTFTSVYLITETFEGEMTEDVIEEGVAQAVGPRVGPTEV